MPTEPILVFGQRLSCPEQTVVALINWALEYGLPAIPSEIHPLVLEHPSGSGAQASWQLAFAPFRAGQEAYSRLQTELPET